MVRSRRLVFLFAPLFLWVPMSVSLLANEASAQPPSVKQKEGLEAKVGVPPAENLLVMVRTTLVALYQAHTTQNFSVLRDLTSPSFQSANSVADLQRNFTSLR